MLGRFQSIRASVHSTKRCWAPRWRTVTEEGEWSSLRNEVTYEESKRVMEGQKSDVDDMDDKALRTVRLTAGILAIGVTGIEVVGPGDVNRLLAGFSIVFFASSAISGLVVYNESNILVGPKASFLNEMRTGDSGDDWEDELLGEMETWITDNQERVELNGALLSVCQLFFVLGVVAGVPAVAGASIESARESHVWIPVVVTVVLYGLIVRYLRSTFEVTR